MLFFFQAEDGIRDLVRSRGLGDVYKRQVWIRCLVVMATIFSTAATSVTRFMAPPEVTLSLVCLLYTSDAADERSSVDLGGRRIIKKKKECIERRSMSIDIKNPTRLDTLLNQ